MLLFNTDLLLDDPLAFAVLMSTIAAALLIGITFHEAAHAYAAKLQGDLTATRLGRLTLNPKKHLDPAGTAMLLIVGFGWGKPVPVNPYNLRNGRRGMAFVSVAGPVSNVALAFVIGAVFQLGLLSPVNLTYATLRSVDPVGWIALVAVFSVQLNLILAMFNLLPIAPLDGGGILAGIAPSRWLPAVAKIQQVGPMVLILVIATSFVGNFSVLGYLFTPARDLANVLIGR
jgi:Zn-dependent protease